MPPVVAQVAQLVEQGIENPRVGGSIPSLGTTEYSKPRPCAGVFRFRPRTPALVAAAALALYFAPGPYSTVLAQGNCP